MELEPDLEGLLHVSELADHKVENPQDVVKVGEEIEVKILRVDIDERKIGLSLKRAQWAVEGEQPAGPVRRRGGLGAETGTLGSLTEDLLTTTKQEQQGEGEGEEPKQEPTEEQQQ